MYTAPALSLRVRNGGAWVCAAAHDQYGGEPYVCYVWNGALQGGTGLEGGQRQRGALVLRGVQFWRGANPEEGYLGRVLASMSVAGNFPPLALGVGAEGQAGT